MAATWPPNPQRASRNRHNNPMLKTQSDRTLPTLPGKMLPDSPQRTMTTRNALWTTANRIGHRTNKRNRNCSRNRNRNNRRRRCRNSGSRAIRRNSRMSRRSRNGRWLGSRRLRTLTYLQMVLHRLKTAIETTMPAKIARMLWRMAMRARQPMTAKPAMRTMLTTMATLLKMPTMPNTSCAIASPSIAKP